MEAIRVARGGGGLSEEMVHARRRPLGYTAFWAFVGYDLVQFTCMFVFYTIAHAQNAALFDAGRAHLAVWHGGVYTILLLTASWCVANAVTRARSTEGSAGRGWLAAGVALAVAFVVAKAVEYGAFFQAGIFPNTDLYWQYYFLMTGIHLLHVAAGAGVLAYFLLRWETVRHPRRLLGFETATIYWHMVDVMWIVIFPVLFLMA